MKRELRISRRSEFQKIYQEGRSHANRIAVLYVLKAKGDTPRVAVAAGRKLGNAVVRNRAKRRLREAIHQLWDRIVPGTQLLLIARAGCLEAPFDTIIQKLKELLERAGVAAAAQEGDR